MNQEVSDEKIVIEGLRVLVRILAQEFYGAAPKSVAPKPEDTQEPLVVQSVEPERPASPGEKLVGAEVIADYLNMPRQAIWRLTRSGLIPCYRVGRLYRYNLQEVERALVGQ